MDRMQQALSAAINMFSRSNVMLHMELRFEDGLVESASFVLPLEVGRGPDNQLRLKAWRVGKRHACIERRRAGIFIVEFGTLGGTLVNGARLSERGALHAGDDKLRSEEETGRLQVQTPNSS